MVSANARDAAACNFVDAMIKYHRKKRTEFNVCLPHEEYRLYRMAHNGCDMSLDIICSLESIVYKPSSKCVLPSVNCNEDFSLSVSLADDVFDYYIHVTNNVDGSPRAVFQPQVNSIIQKVKFYLIATNSSFLTGPLTVPLGKTIYQAKIIERNFKVGIRYRLPRTDKYLFYIRMAMTGSDGSLIDPNLTEPFSGLPNLPYGSPSTACPTCVHVNNNNLRLDNVDAPAALADLFRNYMKYVGYNSSEYDFEITSNDDYIDIILYCKHVPSGKFAGSAYGYATNVGLYGLATVESFIVKSTQHFSDVEVVTNPSTVISAGSTAIVSPCTSVNVSYPQVYLNFVPLDVKFNYINGYNSYSDAILIDYAKPACVFKKICFNATGKYTGTLVVKDPMNNIIASHGSPVSGCVSLPYNAHGTYMVSNLSGHCFLSQTIEVPPVDDDSV